MSTERTGSVAGLLLAAGSSSRMGENKLFFEIDGESLLRRAVDTALSAGLDPVVVVLGHEAQRARGALRELPCQIVVNSQHELGINSSLRTGMENVPPDATAVVVMLADMPFVSRDMIETLVRRYRGSSAALAISRYGDVNAPPMLYDRSLFGELNEPQGEGCGRYVVRRHRDQAEVVSWPPQALTDLDTPEDYERVRDLLAQR